MTQNGKLIALDEESRQNLNGMVMKTIVILKRLNRQTLIDMECHGNGNV